MGKWEAAARLIGVGFYIGGCILGGVVAGRWLDQKLETQPIWMLAGLILGVVVAFYGVYRMVQPLMDNKDNKPDEESN